MLGRSLPVRISTALYCGPKPEEKSPVPGSFGYIRTYTSLIAKCAFRTGEEGGCSSSHSTECSYLEEVLQPWKTQLRSCRAACQAIISTGTLNDDLLWQQTRRAFLGTAMALRSEPHKDRRKDFRLASVHGENPFSTVETSACCLARLFFISNVIWKLQRRPQCQNLKGRNG